ncbi:SDR family NAD(P)-dependent oxidoreductase [Amycolatopsis taiwanensis]|uniref:SDR family NAD(P)-dependent oxidoreductase n=1 Tax=Amycolatopsis taiwanensis TaxID=342230 RepID=UPI00255428E4|nr:SDR family NAD(P)-dependent oxidoreductase [Amycolatopsis taiwanensis]
MRCDVTEASEVDTLLTRMVETFGSLDVMVNNAGSTRDATMRTMTEAQFDRVINVHLKGTWNGTSKAVPRQQEVGRPRQHLLPVGQVGMVGQTNYSAAKAGIVGLTKENRAPQATLPSDEYRTLRVSLAGAEAKLAQLERRPSSRGAVDLGIPTIVSPGSALRQPRSADTD